MARGAPWRGVLLLMARGSRIGRARALLILAACNAITLLACGSEPDKGARASGLPCGAPPGDWQYVLSCRSALLPSLEQCIDYYATASVASVIDTTFRGLCQAQQGEVLGDPCPAEGSIGSCTSTASSGPAAPSPSAVLERQYFYGGNTTPASYKRDCEKEGGVYTAVGSTPGQPASTASAGCGQGSGGEDADDGVAFSVSTVLNGEVLSCTNYVGSITEQELSSVLAQGAETSACPSTNAICGCPSEGVFGTQATIVYYQTSMRGSSSACPNTDSSCGPYRAP